MTRTARFRTVALAMVCLGCRQPARPGAVPSSVRAGGVQLLGSDHVCSGFLARVWGDRRAMTTFVVTTRDCAAQGPLLVRTWMLDPRPNAARNSLIERIYPYVDVVATDPSSGLAALRIQYLRPDTLPSHVITAASVAPGPGAWVSVLRIEEEAARSTHGAVRAAPVPVACQVLTSGPQALRAPDPLRWLPDAARGVFPRPTNGLTLDCEVGLLDAAVGGAVFDGDNIVGAVVEREASEAGDGAVTDGGTRSRLGVVTPPAILRLLQAAQGEVTDLERRGSAASTRRDGLAAGATAPAGPAHEAWRADYGATVRGAVARALCTLRDPVAYPVSALLSTQDRAVLRARAESFVANQSLGIVWVAVTANRESDFTELLEAIARRDREAQTFCTNVRRTGVRDCAERYEHALALGQLRATLAVGAGGVDVAAAVCVGDRGELDASVVVDPLARAHDEVVRERLAVGEGRTMSMVSRTDYGATSLQLFAAPRPAARADDADWRSTPGSCHRTRIHEDPAGARAAEGSGESDCAVSLGGSADAGAWRRLEYRAGQETRQFSCEWLRNVMPEAGRQVWFCRRSGGGAGSEPEQVVASRWRAVDGERILLVDIPASHGSAVWTVVSSVVAREEAP